MNPHDAARAARNKIVSGGKFGLVRSGAATKLDHPYGEPADKLFRLWDVLDDNKSRRDPIHCSPDAPFIRYIDSWYDYPFIAQARLNTPTWEQYNKSCLVQVGACCGFNCWHCYLAQDHIRGVSNDMEFLEPREIVDRYLEEREHQSNKQDSSPIDLFRISGGEPFLVPDLILAVLQELRQRGLDDKIFLWAETNMAPLYRDFVGDHNFLDDIQFDLKSLDAFKNFALHPCFHGISKDDYLNNTALTDFTFDGFLQAFDLLVQSGIDIYPTFGSNVNKQLSVEPFYNAVKAISPEAPKRFALIEYKSGYETVQDRLKMNSGTGALEKAAKLINIVGQKNQVIETWDRLLKADFGAGYPVAPRHEVTL
jgi:uncharacterized Fe-S cluster-containing radical SAM superfamily protein